MTTATARVPVDHWRIDTNVSAETTMGRMAKVCHDAMKNPAIVQYANEIIAAATPRDYRAQIAAIRFFLETYFHFVDNPVGAQLIRDPLSMILDIEGRGFTQGACDDAAVLVATFGMANGLRARFRALAFGSTANADVPYSHVIADLFDGAEWEALDVTKPFDMLRLPAVARTLTFDV